MMENEKIDLKWGKFAMQFCLILCATFLLIFGDRMITPKTLGTPSLGVGLIIAGLAILCFTFRPVKSGQDDFERRLELYSIAGAGTVTIIYAIAWHVTIGLGVDFISNKPVNVIGLPTIMAMSRLFGEQCVRYSYAHKASTSVGL